MRKLPKFHLISWCGNFVEVHSFRVWKLAETAFPPNLHNKNLGKILVFCAMHLKQILSSRIKNKIKYMAFLKFKSGRGNQISLRPNKRKIQNNLKRLK